MNDDLNTVTLYTTGEAYEDVLIEVRCTRLMRVSVKGALKIDLSVSTA